MIVVLCTISYHTDKNSVRFTLTNDTLTGKLWGGCLLWVIRRKMTAIYQEHTELQTASGYDFSWITCHQQPLFSSVRQKSWINLMILTHPCGTVSSYGAMYVVLCFQKCCFLFEVIKCWHIHCGTTGHSVPLHWLYLTCVVISGPGLESNQDTKYLSVTTRNCRSVIY